MKKIFIAFIISISLITFGSIAFAEDVAPKGILPAAPVNEDCKEIMNAFRKLSKENQIKNLRDPATRENTLGCAIKTGKVSLFMLPFFIVSLIQFLIGLAGLICVLFIVIGGYKYITGGITDDKESGKKTIMYAIIGLIVALVSWIVINVVQVQLTR